MKNSREREHLVRVIKVQRDLDACREENVILRNKLLELANECSGCGGTGRVRTPDVLQKVLGQLDAPCSDCADIRRVLA